MALRAEMPSASAFEYLMRLNGLPATTSVASVTTAARVLSNAPKEHGTGAMSGARDTESAPDSFAMRMALLPQTALRFPGLNATAQSYRDGCGHEEGDVEHPSGLDGAPADLRRSLLPADIGAPPTSVPPLGPSFATVHAQVARALQQGLLY
jgi:hypothetical protein